MLIQVLAASFGPAVHPGQPLVDPGDHRQSDQSAQPDPAGAGYCPGGRRSGRGARHLKTFLFAETTNWIDQRLGAG